MLFLLLFTDSFAGADVAEAFVDFRSRIILGPR